MKLLLFFLQLFCLSAALGAPVIDSITPATALAFNQTEVTIRGSGFNAATAVQFGSKPAEILSVSATQIVVRTPLHVPLVVPVTVTALNTTSPVTNAAYFTFQGNWLAYVNYAGASENFPVSEQLTIVDTQTDRTETLFLGFSPSLTALTADGSLAIIFSCSIDFTPVVFNRLVVLDTATRTILIEMNGILAAPFFLFSTLTIPASLNVLYCSFLLYEDQNNPTTSILALDLARDNLLQPLGEMAIDSGDSGIALSLASSTDSRRVYGCDPIGGELSVINTANNSSIATIDLTSSNTILGVVGLSQDGKRAYVTQSQQGLIKVIDTVLNSVAQNVPVGGNPASLALTRGGQNLCVGNFANNFVTFIDTLTFDTTALDLGGFSTAIVTSPDQAKFYVVSTEQGVNVNEARNTVYVIDTIQNTITASVAFNDTALNCYLMALTPDGSKLYVTNRLDSLLYTIDTRSPTLSYTSQAVEIAPNRVFMTADQAPLARFTRQGEFINQTIVFDASSSNSPTGTIASYTWEFGDGQTLTTTEPVVTHTYATLGERTASLTVTNSAGTSTSQIVELSYNYLFGNYVRNNGGPSATTSQTFIVRSISPPRRFRGRQVENRFLTQVDYVNLLSWKPSPTQIVVRYELFRDGRLIASIGATQPLVYADYGRNPDHFDHYHLVAVTEAKARSRAVTLTLP